MLRFNFTRDFLDGLKGCMFVLLLQLLKRTYVLGVSYIQDDVAGEGWAVLAPTQPAKPL